MGPIAFLQPWILAGLLALPLIWLLLRLRPPAPRRVAFPPLALLLRLVAPEETPARTPWWLLLLRLAIAALVLLALAGPVLDPAPVIGGRGPVLLVVDDGWAAAPNWQRRVGLARGLLEQAERDSRPVVVLKTAPDGRSTPLEPQPARRCWRGSPAGSPIPGPSTMRRRWRASKHRPSAKPGPSG
ncbi:MAG: BatA domain-containing protein [Geminicoccaceae bacterium]